MLASLGQPGMPGVARGPLPLALLWSITARAAVTLGDRAKAVRARDAVLPARGEIAGAASGTLTAGPVSRCLGELEDFLAGERGATHPGRP